MKGTLKFLQATIVGGIFYLVPIVVLVMIVGKALGIAHQLVAPLSRHVEHETWGGLAAPTVIAILALLLFCFLAGLFSRTAIARAIVDWLETRILENLPGYAFLKSMGENVAGIAGTRIQQAVLVRIEDAWQIGLLIERIEGGHVSVFVPGVPNPNSGSIYYMTEDRIRPLDVPPATAMKALRKMGFDSSRIVRGKL
jgi:uncharacterized membrane protein